MSLYSTKIPSTNQDKDLWRRAVLFQFVYSLAGLILGLICMLGGIVLFLRGIAGSSSWTADLFGMKTQMSDAGPGAILFVVGLLAVGLTRYKVSSVAKTDTEAPRKTVDLLPTFSPLEQLHLTVQRAMSESESHGFHSFRLRAQDGINMTEVRRFRDYFGTYIAQIDSLVTIVDNADIDEAATLVNQFFSETALNGWLDFPPVCYVLKDPILSLYSKVQSKGGDIKRLSYASCYVFRGWEELESGTYKNITESDRRKLMSFG